MKTFCITLVLITITTFVVFSQGQKDSKTIKISGTEEFFQSFRELKSTPKRGEFETLEDYKKRLPKPYDSSKIVYLAFGRSILEKPYSYDIETEKLTFVSGKLYSEKFQEYQPSEGTQVLLYNKMESKGEYEASNAYGKKVTVDKEYVYDYVVNLTNINILPDSIFDRDKGCFRLTLNKSPKEAEKLSKNLCLVIGIKPIDPNLSSFECYLTMKPTIDSPTEFACFHDIADAKFVSLLLYDETSKKIILQYNE